MNPNSYQPEPNALCYDAAGICRNPAACGSALKESRKTSGADPVETNNLMSII